MSGKRKRDAATRTFTQKEFDDGVVIERAKVAIEDAQYTKKIPYCDDRRPSGERVAPQLPLLPASTPLAVRFDSDPQLGVSERKTRLAQTIDEMDELGRPCIVEYVRKCVEWAMDDTPGPLVDLVVLYTLAFELDFPWYSPFEPMVLLTREHHTTNPAKDRTRFHITADRKHTTNVKDGNQIQIKACSGYAAMQLCRSGETAYSATDIHFNVLIPHQTESESGMPSQLLTRILIDNWVFNDQGTRIREFSAIPFIYPCELWRGGSPTRPPKARTVITGSMLARPDVFVPDSVLHVTRLSLECLQT
jgi:hypothetical protein